METKHKKCPNCKKVHLKCFFQPSDIEHENLTEYQCPTCGFAWTEAKEATDEQAK